MDTTKTKIKTTIVEPGDNMPCHESRIINTKERMTGKLKIWYFVHDE